MECQVEELMLEVKAVAFVDIVRKDVFAFVVL